jgi:hypothetical protein
MLQQQCAWVELALLIRCATSVKAVPIKLPIVTHLQNGVTSRGQRLLLSHIAY